jgi:two-component system, NarL family, invasion response regulator UvrY
MGITVLLVDDHRVLRDGVRRLLETAGDIRVVAVADNGREALQKGH